MATTYKATAALDTAQPISGTGVIKVPFSFTLSAAFLLGDILRLAKIPKHATVTDFYIDCPDLDGGTDLLWDIGDTLDDDCYANNVTLGQAAGKFVGTFTAGNNGAIAGSLPRQNTSAVAGTDTDETFLIMTVAAAGSAVTSGTIKGWVEYTMQPSYAEVRA